MQESVYVTKLPDTPEVVVFINGIVTRNLKGFFWLYRHLFWIKKAASKAPGCLQIKAGICSINEVMITSYWQNEEALGEFFKSDDHHKMLRWVQQHPEALTLYNETYQPQRSGKYSNEPHGLAAIFGKVEK